MKCYKCKRTIADDSKFCPKCGSPQQFTQELIDRAVGDDQMAITQLYEMTRDNVYYTIKTMISDEDLVQDLTQDTFLKAMRYLGQLKEPAAFRGWIKKIARNMTIDVLRKRKVISFSQMVSADSDEMVEFEDDRMENLPEVVIDRQETTRLLGEILDTLSPEQRIVAELFYYEGLSVKEIAEELAVNENTIKSRLRAARKKIEIGVLELEKKGTKLYGLAPIPFLLLLFRSQDAYAAELSDGDILQAMQAKDGRPPMERVDSGQAGGRAGKRAARAARAGAGAASKGMTAKILAGVVAVALLGGAAAGILSQDREAEAPVPMEEPTENASVTARDFEGYYTSPDTDIAITIRPVSSIRADVVLEDRFGEGAEPFNREGTAVMGGETLAMDLETPQGDTVTFTLAGDRLIVEAPERYQAAADTVISGTYQIGEADTGRNVDIRDYIGTYMNGNNIGAGRITITENDPRSVRVRLEAFRTVGDREFSTIFEDIGRPFENGIYIEVSGQRVGFTEGTRGHILEVPEPLKREWDILESTYEEEYERIEETPEATRQEAYQAIIDEYAGAAQIDLGAGGDSFEQIYGEEYPHVNVKVMGHAASRTFDLCYVYYDVNGDGADELLIGSTQWTPTRIIDLYTFDGRQAVRSGDCRAADLTIYTDGRIWEREELTAGPPGEEYGVGANDIWRRIADDGYTMEVEQEYNGHFADDGSGEVAYRNGVQIAFEEYRDMVTDSLASDQKVEDFDWEILEEGSGSG